MDSTHTIYCLDDTCVCTLAHSPHACMPTHIHRRVYCAGRCMLAWRTHTHNQMKCTEITPICVRPHPSLMTYYLPWRPSTGLCVRSCRIGHTCRSALLCVPRVPHPSRLCVRGSAQPNEWQLFMAWPQPVSAATSYRFVISSPHLPHTGNRALTFWLHQLRCSLVAVRSRIGHRWHLRTQQVRATVPICLATPTIMCIIS